MKTKELLLEVKALEDAPAGTIEGYAAVFNNIDRVNEVIVPGAFKQTLSKRKKAIPLLWSHNNEEVIGKLTDLREDSYGLYVRGQLNLKVAKAQEVYELLKNGDVSGMSIGYRVNDFTEEDNGVVKLLDIELFEASIVPIPANELAEVVTVKTVRTDDLKEIKSMLESIIIRLDKMESGKFENTKYYRTEVDEKLLREIIDNFKTVQETFRWKI
jgi:HK97 family phage prohead protease